MEHNALPDWILRKMKPQQETVGLNAEKSKTLLGFLKALIFSSALLQISVFVSGVLIARTLGPEGRGIYGEILLYAQGFFTLTCLSLSDGAIYTVPEVKLNHRRFLPSLLTAFFLLGLLLAFSIFGFHFLRIIDENFRWVLAIIAITWCCYAVEISFIALEKVRMNFKWVAIVQSGAPVLFSIFVLYIYVQDLDVSPYEVVFLFLLAKLVFVLICMVRRWSYLFGGLNTDFMRQSLARGGVLHIALVVSTLVTMGDRFILSVVGSDQLLGYYFVAYSVAGVGVGIISAVVMNLVFPALVAADANDRKKEVAFFLKFTSILSFFPVPPLLLCLPLITPVVYGQAFQASADMLVWLIPAFALNPLKLVIGEVLRSSSRIWQIFSINVVYVSSFSMLFLFNMEGMSLEFFIFSIGASNLMTIFAGLYFLKRNGDLDTLRDLLPSLVDFYEIYLMSRSIFRR